MRLVEITAAIVLSACQQPAPSADDPSTAANRTDDPGPASNEGTIVADRPPSEPVRVSRFTRLGDESCTKPQTNAETGEWTRRCTGIEPYDLEWSSGDLREDLAVISGAGKTALHFPTMVAKGAFDSIAPAVEWRGPADGRPDRLVARVRVANDQGEDDGGHLVIARLQPRACIVGIVPASTGQSDTARAIADTEKPVCLGD